VTRLCSTSAPPSGGAFVVLWSCSEMPRRGLGRQAALPHLLPRAGHAEAPASGDARPVRKSWLPASWALQGELRSLERIRTAPTARPGIRVNSADTGVSRPCGAGSSRGYGVASELSTQTDLSLYVTDPVGARSLRLRALPVSAGGAFVVVWSCGYLDALRALIENHPLPYGGSADSDVL